MKVGRQHTGSLPGALVEGGPRGTRDLAERLLALGERIAREGTTGRDAASALLLRKRPSGDGFGDGPLRRMEESAIEAALRLALGLGDSYLPIQGPPGTGKTFIGAEQILALIADGRTVGITGPSHAVIHNLIDEVLEHAAEWAARPVIGQRADESNPFLHDSARRMNYDELEHGLRCRELGIAAGTVWMWGRKQFQESVDMLFVRRSWSAFTFQCPAGDGCTAKCDFTRRPAAARSAKPGSTPTGGRHIGARTCPSCSRNHARRGRSSPRQNMADAPPALHLHL